MTEPLHVDQFAIVDHEPVDRGPNAGIFPGKGPADDRAELFILAEGTTPAGEAFAGHVVSAAGQSWQTLDMSLTGAVRRVVRDAETSLADWNRKSIAQHRVSIGLACFARRGGQAVIGQVGPSAVFYRPAGGPVRALYTDEAHGAPIGLGAPAEPQLTRVDLKPGDRILLLSTAGLAQLDDHLISGILALPRQHVLPNIYHYVRELRHVTALLIETEAPADATGEPPASEDVIGGTALPPPADHRPRSTSDARTFQPSLFISDRSDYEVEAARRQLHEVSARAKAATRHFPATAAEIPAPLRRAVGENGFGRATADGRPRASAESALVPLAGGRGFASSTPAETQVEFRKRDRRRDSFSRGLVRDDLAPPPPPPSGAAPLVDSLANERRARSAVLSPASEAIATENVVSMTGGGALVRPRAGMSGRWKGGGALSSRSTFSIGRLPPTWLIVLAGVAAIVAIVGIVVAPQILSRNDDQRLASLVDDAQQKLATSRAVQDAGERRLALTGAQGLLLEARDLEPTNSEVARLLLEVNETLAGMDAIHTPSAVTVLANLEQFGDAPVAATGLVVAGAQAYLLDSASSQVVAITLATGDYRAVYGPDQATQRARPVAIAYFDTAELGEPTLLVADANRNLWSVSGDAIVQLPFEAPPAVTDITVQGRDLYVLDAPGSAIYRFSPADGGFLGGAKILESPELAHALRLSLAGEEIYTADANGQLRRFAGKVQLALSAAGIDTPLTVAHRPAPLPETGEVAVLDSANNRIVVLREDGTFDRQYRHADFARAGTFTISRGDGYIFSGGQLRRITW